MKKIVVLGGGISGYGSAILAKKKGFDVFLSDKGRIADRYKAKLDQWQVPYEEGHHSEERILAADEVVKSPGIPDKAPLIVKLREAGIPVISEMEFAGRYLGKARTICVTGSNGKTTTTSLIYKIMRDAGYNVALGGNIGESFAYSVATGDYDWYVLELSSFQLDGMYKFRAHIGVLMNITPDHLDRYDYCFQNYVDAKMRILQNQTSEDAFIFWNDDPIVTKELAKYNLKSHLCPFSEFNEEGCVGYIEDGKYKLNFPSAFEMPQADMSLRGKHNIYNSLAAGLACNIVGIDHETLHKGLSDFPGVEHRLEKVGKFKGVYYVNDSKATNVDACWYALESMTTPTILIIGGKDKGNDYNQIKDLVKEKCAGIVYLGADNQKLHDNFDALGIPVRDTHSMKDCVAACQELAKPGDTVLLSPCCASFDLFKNMEDRGEQFKALARAIGE